MNASAVRILAARRLARLRTERPVSLLELGPMQPPDDERRQGKQGELLDVRRRRDDRRAVATEYRARAARQTELRRLVPPAGPIDRAAATTPFLQASPRRGGSAESRQGKRKTPVQLRPAPADRILFDAGATDGCRNGGARTEISSVYIINLLCGRHCFDERKAAIRAADLLQLSEHPLGGAARELRSVSNDSRQRLRLAAC